MNDARPVRQTRSRKSFAAAMKQKARQAERSDAVGMRNAAVSFPILLVRNGIVRINWDGEFQDQSGFNLLESGTCVERIRRARVFMASDVSRLTSEDLRQARRSFALLLHPDRQRAAERSMCSSALGELNDFIDLAIKLKADAQFVRHPS